MIFLTFLLFQLLQLFIIQVLIFKVFLNPHIVHFESPQFSHFLSAPLSVTLDRFTLLGTNLVFLYSQNAVSAHGKKIVLDCCCLVISKMKFLAWVQEKVLSYLRANIVIGDRVSKAPFLNSIMDLPFETVPSEKIHMG